MIQKISYTLIFLIGMVACSNNAPKKSLVPSNINSKRDVMVIDLDKEAESNAKLRGKENLLIDSPIYIGDNDEVSFKGDIIEKNSPIQVKIGDNDEVAFRGKEYNINTMELRNGDIIQMRGASGKLFVEMEVIK